MLQVIALIAATPICAVLAFFLVRVVRENDAAHDAMREDIQELKEDVAKIDGKLDVLLEVRKDV